jgi:enoyl-CoA hydratase
LGHAVNQSVGAMGFTSALNACFTIHQLNHAPWSEICGGSTAIGTAEYGMDDWRAAPPLRHASRAEA